MEQDAHAALSQMAVELFYLREEAKVAGEPFLAYLIEMVAVKAERLGAEPVPEPYRERPQLVWAGR